MKNVKHLVALFFAVAFFSSKIAGLHVLTHHTDDADVAHCEFCDITTAIGFTPLLSSDRDIAVPTKILFSAPKLNSGTAQAVFYSKPLESHRFTRPPPFS